MATQAIRSLLLLFVVSMTSLALCDVNPHDYFDLLTSAQEHRLRAGRAWSTDVNFRRQVAGLEAELSKGGGGVVKRMVGLMGADLSQTDSRLNESQLNCSSSLQLLQQAVTAREEWALHMVDAWGKPASGMLQGEVRWLGSFQECLTIDSSRNQTSPEQILGQYCLATVTVNLQNLPTSIDIGVCVPDVCNATEVKLLLKDVIYMLLNQTVPVTATCQERELELNDTAWIIIGVLFLFGWLLMFGTTYDVIAVQVPKWDREVQRKAGVNGDSSIAVETSVAIPHEGTLLLDEKKTKKKAEDSLSVCSRLLVSFSVYTNGQKLLDTKQPSGSLTAVHGIRFLSMTWVLLGHTLAFGISTISNIPEFSKEVTDRWTYLVITNATVSVDTFFMLSGLLVAYLLTKELERVRNPRKVNWPLFYFHRFWRLTPPYMLVMMTFVTLFPYWGDGPQWPQDGIGENCKDNWWTNLLYVNNLVNDKKQCMGWAWYLANDMQFYILSPLMVIPLVVFPIAGCVITFLFLLATVLTAGLISSHYQLGPGFVGVNQGMGSYFSEYYVKPYCRMGPYIIGLFVGYLLQRHKCKIIIAKSVNLLCWCCAAAMCLAVIYGLWPVDHPMSVSLAATYNGLHRTAWALGVAWVVFACATGYGGFVNTLLSWKALIPLSRLTYCCYLVHPVVLYVGFLSQKSLVHMSDLNFVYSFLANFMVTYAVALVTSLTFEAPMLGLERIIFKKWL